MPFSCPVRHLVLMHLKQGRVSFLIAVTDILRPSLKAQFYMRTKVMCSETNKMTKHLYSNRPMLHLWNHPTNGWEGMGVGGCELIVVKNWWKWIRSNRYWLLLAKNEWEWVKVGACGLILVKKSGIGLEWANVGEIWVRVGQNSWVWAYFRE